MLTVLLATRNRARILRDVLESFSRLQSPPSGWKLVVVDNGSTDESAAVITAFARRLPLEFVSEPVLGKNTALNTGLARTEGDLTVLTDDDVFPYADWLVQLRKAADEQPACSIFGGVVVPRWEASPPEWIDWLDKAPVFAITPASLKEGILPSHRIDQVFGPNMAIRTDIFASGIRFDTSIGPRGSDYAMGSETELLLRLNRQGYQAWHVQTAIVEHLIRKEQLELSWVVQRTIRHGRGHQRRHPEVNLWWDMPRRVYRALPREIVIMALARATLNTRLFFRSRMRFNFTLGTAIESRVMARERRSQTQLAAAVVPRNP
jgi:glycosyltransferase involved in cell wall biosynthesis